MTKWRLKCSACGNEWDLGVSFDISDMKQLYYYCRICGSNTIHLNQGKIEV